MKGNRRMKEWQKGERNGREEGELVVGRKR